MNSMCIYIYNNGDCVWWCHWFLVISVFHFLSAALATDSNCNQCFVPYLVCALLCCKASTSQSKIPWHLGRKNSTCRAHQVRLQRVCYIISGRLIGRAASIVAVWQPNSTEVGSQNRFWAALSTSADAKIIPTPSCTAKGFCRITKGRSDSHLVALAINLSWNLFSWISAGWRAVTSSGHFSLFPTKVVVLNFRPKTISTNCPFFPVGFCAGNFIHDKNGKQPPSNLVDRTCFNKPSYNGWVVTNPWCHWRPWMGHLALCHWLMYPCIFHSYRFAPLYPLYPVLATDFLRCCHARMIAACYWYPKNLTCAVATTDLSHPALQGSSDLFALSQLRMRHELACLVYRTFVYEATEAESSATQSRLLREQVSQRAPAADRQSGFTFEIIWNQMHTLFDIATDCFT